MKLKSLLSLVLCLLFVFPVLPLYSFADDNEDRVPLIYEEIELSDIFSDNMVLQRNKPINVFGNGPAGASVTVTLFENSVEINTADTVIGENGEWLAVLNEMEAGGPYKLVVTDSEEFEVKIENVMSGEVWLAAGQSNMFWPITRSMSKDTVLVMESYDYPDIRFYCQYQKDYIPTGRDYTQWEVGSPIVEGEIPWWYNVMVHFAQQLYEELHVPIGIVQAAHGGVSIYSYLSDDMLSTRGEVPDRTLWANPSGSLPWVYEQYISDLVPFTMSGFAWYQGEADSSDPEYADNLAFMVEQYRELFDDESLSFLITQLPANTDGNNNDWMFARERQAKVVDMVENTAVTCSIDLYEGKLLHPINKKPVGDRLALAALGLTYKKDIEYRSPTADIANIKIKGKEITIPFKYADNGLIKSGLYADEEILGFQISASNGVFRNADNVRIDGNKIVLSSNQIDTPVHVRYQFVNVPCSNLYSADSLPVMPFRTDSLNTNSSSGFYTPNWPVPSVKAEEAQITIPSSDVKIDQIDGGISSIIEIKPDGTNISRLEFEIDSLPQGHVVNSVILRLHVWDGWEDETGSTSFNIFACDSADITGKEHEIYTDILYGQQKQIGFTFKDHMLDISLDPSLLNTNGQYSMAFVYTPIWTLLEKASTFDKFAEIYINYVKEVESITIEEPPIKTIYSEGQKFDGKGMIVKAAYKDKTSGYITSYSIDKNMLSIDDDKATISYGGKTADINITVTPKNVTDIYMTRKPLKTAFEYDEAISLPSCVLMVYYDNGTFEHLPVLPDMITDYSPNQPGEQIVKINAGDKFITFTVIVAEGNVTVRKKGFITNNGQNSDIAISDAIEIFRHLAGKKILQGDNEFAADIDGKNGVTIQDAIYIFRYLASKITMEDLQGLHTNEA